MKMKISYGKCSMFVQGLDMNCPLCGALVESGQRHECEKAEPQPKRKRLKAGRVTPGESGK